MFEKVLAGEGRRRHQRNRHAMAASVLAHALIAAGATQLPISTGFSANSVEEVVSYVDVRLPQTEAPASLPAPRAHPARAGQASAAPADALEGARAPAPESASSTEALPDLSVVTTAASISTAGSARLAVYLPDAPPPAVLREGDVVEADVLAERPRLSNRAEMERLWKQLYPPLLEMRGITGESLVSFVIDEEGRVMEETVELLSASRDEFGAAALRGIGRLRFRPMQVGGIAVRVRTTLPVVWRLNAA